MKEAVSQVAAQTDKLACPDVRTSGERPNLLLFYRWNEN